MRAVLRKAGMLGQNQRQRWTDAHNTGDDADSWSGEKFGVP
jgi:hypothetical protein